MVSESILVTCSALITMSPLPWWLMKTMTLSPISRPYSFRASAGMTICPLSPTVVAPAELAAQDVAQESSSFHRMLLLGRSSRP